MCFAPPDGLSLGCFVNRILRREFLRLLQDRESLRILRPMDHLDVRILPDALLSLCHQTINVHLHDHDVDSILSRIEAAIHEGC
jgi:hypothetical protein